MRGGVAQPSSLEQLILIRKGHREKNIESNPSNLRASLRIYIQLEAHAEVLCRRRRTIHAIVITVTLWLSDHAMDPQPTGLGVPAFTAPT
jgi:hypothetical protein